MSALTESNNVITVAQPETLREKLYFSMVDVAVLFDRELCKTAIVLFGILVFEAAKLHSNQVSISIPELARLLGRTDSVVQMHLRTLIAKGIIICQRQRTLSKKQYVTKDGKVRQAYINLPNLYIIVGRFAPCYRGTPYEPLPQETEKVRDSHKTEKIIPGWYDFQYPKDSKNKEEIESKDTLKREADSPKILTNTHQEGEVPEESIKTTEAVLETPPAEETNSGQAEVTAPNEGKPSNQSSKHEEVQREAPNSEEADTPKEEQSQPEPKTAQGYNLTGIPEIMKPTAEYMLMKTGRDELSEDEKALFGVLANMHYPSLVQKKIDEAVERFKKQGKSLTLLRVSYIMSTLKYYKTFGGSKNLSKRHEKSAKKTAKTARGQIEASEEKSETLALPMPIEEAEKVIAEYKSEEKPEAKEPELAIPVALAELFEKIEDKEWKLAEEYEATLPKDECGCVVYPEGVDACDRRITLEDYIKLKYPDAEDEEMCRDYNGTMHKDISELFEIRRLQRAFDIDYACASCFNPDECQLPEGVKKGQPKPEVKRMTSKDGKKCFGIAFEGCIKCKHSKPVEKDAEEERKAAEIEARMKRCGITAVQREKTFESYSHEGAVAELVIAKAKAIQAAQKKTNLILAGRAGAGKTHLATAIALEAIKHGSYALVRSVPELLDEIKLANRNNTDPFGAMMKYKSAPCLVLDDLGKQRNTEAVWDYLYQIINYRYQYGLQTIITTNAYTPDELEAKWYEGKAEPLVSRLLENGDWITIREAKDYRLKRFETVKSEPAPTIALPAKSKEHPAQLQIDFGV